MNTFSSEIMNQIVNSLNENATNIEAMKARCAEMPVEDAAQMLLIEKYALAQIEAEEIVNDLKKGVSEFNAQMSETRSNGVFNVRKNLDKLTQGLSNDERKVYLANVLTTFQLVASKRKGLEKSEIEAQLSENMKLDEDSIVCSIESLSKSGFSLDLLGDDFAGSVNADVISKVASNIKANENDSKLIAAVWLYIAQRDGQIKLSNSEIALPASTIGTMAAAGVEAILTTSEFVEGQIDLETWQTVMKWILGTVIFVGLLGLAMFLAIYASFEVLFLLLEMFGTGTFALVVSSVITLLLSMVWVWADEKAIFSILEWLGDFYDEYIGVITDKVKSWYQSIKEWLANSNTDCDGDADKPQESNTVITTNNNENTDYEGLCPQPVLA